MKSAILRSLLSSLVALCLLLGPPRALGPQVRTDAQSQREQSADPANAPSSSSTPSPASSSQEDGDQAKDSKEGKDAKESETSVAFAARHQLPQRLPSSGPRRSGTLVAFPAPPVLHRAATRDAPVAPHPSERLPRRLI